ncbi:MAG TPA: YXWGXW repeat-containing protein [Gemmatimonadaceae bacterium]|nr:YXWGXW repeat-containing protein [Gemmatimonadaceae bacterium]
MTRTRRFLALASFALLASAPGCQASAPPRRMVGVSFIVREPPRPRREVIVTRPGPGYVWIAGYWHWVEPEYVWVPGRWTLPPRGFRRWEPGRWQHEQRGWYWVEGRWR